MAGSEKDDGGHQSPIHIVARQVSSSYGSMGQEQISSALKRLLWRAMRGAMEAIRIDPLSQDALDMAQEYRALGETIVSFGSTLTAFDDMEEYELSIAAGDKARVS